MHHYPALHSVMQPLLSNFGNEWQYPFNINTLIMIPQFQVCPLSISSSVQPRYFFCGKISNLRRKDLSIELKSSAGRSTNKGLRRSWSYKKCLFANPRSFPGSSFRLHVGQKHWEVGTQLPPQGRYVCGGRISRVSRNELEPNPKNKLFGLGARSLPNVFKVDVHNIVYWVNRPPASRKPGRL